MTSYAEMMNHPVGVDDFTTFVADFERPIRQALIASYGGEVGRDACCEALAYGWEHWDRVRAMSNPVGYLYTVGRNWARKSIRQSPPPTVFEVVDETDRHVEPELQAALAELSHRQRSVVILVHCFQWSLAETAEVLELKKTTIQNHLERGMASLRQRLGETS